MGRKGKRSGVVWNTDPTTGAPRGAEVNEWDGLSRTHKRNQARAVIEQRRELLVAYISLDPEVRIQAIDQVKLDFQDRLEEEFPLSEGLIEQLERLASMKRSGAKQRQIKHLSASLDDQEWEIILSIKACAEPEP
jgi:hypothetical protein